VETVLKSTAARPISSCLRVHLGGRHHEYRSADGGGQRKGRNDLPHGGYRNAHRQSHFIQDAADDELQRANQETDERQQIDFASDVRCILNCFFHRILITPLVLSVLVQSRKCSCEKSVIKI